MDFNCVEYKDLDTEANFEALVLINVTSKVDTTDVIRKYKLKNHPEVKIMRHVTYIDSVGSVATIAVEYTDAKAAEREWKQMISDFEGRRIKAVIAGNFLDYLNRLEELNEQRNRQKAIVREERDGSHIVYVDTIPLNLSDDESNVYGKERIGNIFLKAFERYGKIINSFVENDRLLAFDFSHYSSAYATFLAYHMQSWRGGCLVLSINSPDGIISELSVILT